MIILKVSLKSYNLSKTFNLNSNMIILKVCISFFIMIVEPLFKFQYDNT